MWIKAIQIITEYNLNQLSFFKGNNLNNINIKNNVSIFVVQGIMNLPIFFSFPLKIYSSLLWVLFLRKGQADRLYRLNIPFFGILNKLIKSLVLLKIFDDLSISEIKTNHLLDL